MELKQLRPHISIGCHESGRPALVVEDYELFDFLDDFLTDECDLPYECTCSTERVGGEIVTMFFPISIQMQDIEANILRLTPEQVEEIYQLNNK